VTDSDSEVLFSATARAGRIIHSADVRLTPRVEGGATVVGRTE
jgi:hypothetical protein